MNLLDRVTSLFSNSSQSTPAPTSTPTTPADPPHILRQHYAVSTRVVRNVEVYSVAPMKFGDTSNPNTVSYDPHTSALDELPPALSAQQAVLYLLPGGFAKPIQPRNWDFIGQLAEAGLRVEIPLYGLIPHYNVTHAIPAIRQIYAELVADHGADSITVIADSAGGSLALGTFIADRFYSDELLGETSGNEGAEEAANQTTNQSPTTSPDIPLPSPRQIILNAPWLDMDLSNPGIDTLVGRDPILDPSQLRPQGNLWSQGLTHRGMTDSSTCTHHPCVSPINLSPGTRWTEMLNTARVDIFCGDRDISLVDSERFRDILADQEIDVTLHLQPGGVHMYHLGKSRDGKAARKKMVALARNEIT